MYTTSENATEFLKNDFPVLNALHLEMPECDVKGRKNTLDSFQKSDNCYVYCAQRSCSAAKNYISANADVLADKCAQITYLHNGALSMPPSLLVDGDKCHSNILKHNSKGNCITCTADTSIDVYLNNVKHEGATYSNANLPRPEWYARKQIYSKLPPQFSQDQRYLVPVLHEPVGDTLVEFDPKSLGMEEDALLAFWASKKTSTVAEAHRAYGNFENSGITKCSKNKCRFVLERPASYTADGKVSKPHIHMTHWEGSQWSDNVKTIHIP